LETAVESLPQDKFIETKRSFPPHTHSLVTSKLPFPYLFLNGPESLDYGQLPDKRFFRNDLADQEISDELYEKARNIWHSFGCTSFKQLVFYYNMADCVLLFDLISYFREIIYGAFGLELTSFLSLPQLSFTCMLKLSKVQIQLFDQSMEEAFDLTKRSLYGGIVTCNKRYVEASEKRVIDFIDFTSLYSCIMLSYKLPISDYTFIPVNSQDWATLNCDGDHNFLLELDIVFPDTLHDSLDCLLPICEHKIPPRAKTSRLVSDFTPKYNYVLSLQHFQLLLWLGVQITKIHRALQFRQAFYMKEYVEIVAEWRRQARDSFSSTLFKSMANFLWGKCCERIEFHKSVEIVTSEKRLEKLVRKGTYKDRHICTFPNFQMVIVESSKGVINYNKPVIVGAMILSLSKVHLWSFWYKILRPTLGLGTFICTVDTDSILYFTDCPNYLEKIQSIAEHFDMSNLDESHPLYSKTNHKVPGKLKFETNGKRVLAVCCVKSKCYSLLFEDTCVKKLKGIQKNYVKNKLTFEDYKQCVLNQAVRYATFKNIICKQHELYTVQQSKLALECSDYKRHILSDGINTLAFGNCKLRYLN
jgi:hypothetical protein